VAAFDDSTVEEPSYSSGGGLRIAVQVRPFVAQELFIDVNPGPGFSIDPSMPLVTPGVRLLDDGVLFVGLGLGFTGVSRDSLPTGGMTSEDRSQGGFAIGPLVSYDLISETHAALHLLASFNIASVGDVEICPSGGSCMDATDSGVSGLGLNLGAGVRGKINEALAIGGEFGWGFMSGSGQGEQGYFTHGIMGTLLFEASVGI
jgi:hypothetical protein